jgi:thioredoxin-like negative regulator of GroEL
MRHRASWPHTFLLAIAASLLALPLAADPPPAAAAAGDSAPAAEALARADRLLQQKEYVAAAKAYRQATQRSAGRCLPCSLGLARALYGAGEFEEAVAAADAAATAADQPGAIAAAVNLRGLALLSSAHGDAKSLRGAEAAFRQVLAATDAPLARFNLGLSLLRQGRDPEGVAELREFLARDPASPRAAEARSLIVRPLRARKKLLTDLRLETLEGVVLDPDSFAGRIVLLDFWGTWCPPCRNAVPLLKDLNESLRGRPFTLVSIADEWDDDRDLRKFVAGNGMDWPQVWDRTHGITAEAGVDVYPTYVLIGPDGEVLSTTIGEKGLYRGLLRRRLDEALRELDQGSKPVAAAD